MGRVPDIKRIQKEDFENDFRDLIDKLAFPINSFMEQTKSALDGNIDFTNLNQKLVTIDTVVDGSGVPTIDTRYKSTLKTKVAGHMCINVANLSNPSTYPTGQPFISYTQVNGIVTILNITGLQAGDKYRLTVLTIGQ